MSEGRDGVREIIAMAAEFGYGGEGDGRSWVHSAFIADRKQAYRAADEILAALQAAGMAVVPREPTEEMLWAVGMFQQSPGRRAARADWIAMVDAILPSPPQKAEADER